jgi:hypothetical protein
MLDQVAYFGVGFACNARGVQRFNFVGGPPDAARAKRYGRRP